MDLERRRRISWSVVRRARRDSLAYRWLLRAAVATAAIVLAAPVQGYGTREASAGSASVDPAWASTNGSIVHGALLANTSPGFWGVGIHTNNSSGIWTDPALRTFLNGTPFRWFRYGTNTEQCNITANVLYADNGTPVPSGCNFNVSAFKTWCESQHPRCHSILGLPGENNDSGEDAYIARWIVSTVGFQPDYWWIGNEPSLWTHFGIPWGHWSPTDRSRATPLGYAIGLRAEIRAVMAVDPGARFVGLEASCGCDPAWFQTVMRVDGPLIAAIGYHAYPATGSPNTTLQKFLDPLIGPLNITSSYAQVRADIAGLCRRCDSIPIELHEYNAGPGRIPSNFAGTYANALFLAASATQALKANVSQFSVYDLQSNESTDGYAMINRTDVVGPTGELFSAVLVHLVLGQVYSAPLHTSIPSVWSVLTEDRTRATLLVVNANLTTSLNLSTGSFVRPGARGYVERWLPALASPSNSTGPIAANYTVPPEGILLMSLPPVAVPSPPVHSTGVRYRGGPAAEPPTIARSPPPFGPGRDAMRAGGNPGAVPSPGPSPPRRGAAALRTSQARFVRDPAPPENV